MTNINILDPHVADMIAAGEVVERPASVIKELVENSIDARASSVTIEIKNGGSSLIRVIDNGIGMSPEDAGIAFMRHATSKIKDEHGLDSISTMGFRGEALAAISAVSRIEMTTREQDAEQGTRIVLEAGEIQTMDECGCPCGTTISVRDLFYNTPARRKFLKSDRSETTACTQTAVRCALSHPDVAIHYIKDDNEEFFTPGDGNPLSAMYAIFGRDFANKMLECSGSNDKVSVTGFVSSPAACRGNRAYQYFFCNNRYIKSPLLQAAVEQAYENSMLVGHYPACAIYVDISYGAVDVNVHPTKTEVKFMEERKVFDAVYHAVLSAVQKEDLLNAPPRSSEKKEPSYAGSSVPSGSSFPTYEMRPSPSSGTGFSGKQQDSFPQHSNVFSSRTEEAPAPFAVRAENAEQTAMPEYVSQSSSASVSATSATLPKPPADIPPFRMIGEAMNTYILVQQEDKLILIDKHACHERIIFDKLLKEDRSVMAQILMVPVTVKVDEETSRLLEENGELLTDLGFELEPFGDDSYIIRAVPCDMYESDVEATFEEVCQQLKDHRNIDLEARKTNILKTVACKAAIKAGWKTDVRELFVLAEAVISQQIKYCPHGRPVAIVYTREDLDKEFKRIV